MLEKTRETTGFVPEEVILVKLGEIVLKGLNRNTFETVLLQNMRRRLAGVGKFDV